MQPQQPQQGMQPQQPQPANDLIQQQAPMQSPAAISPQQQGMQPQQQQGIDQVYVYNNKYMTKKALMEMGFSEAQILTLPTV